MPINRPDSLFRPYIGEIHHNLPPPRVALMSRRFLSRCTRPGDDIETTQHFPRYRGGRLSRCLQSAWRRHGNTMSVPSAAQRIAEWR